MTTPLYKTSGSVQISGTFTDQAGPITSLAWYNVKNYLAKGDGTTDDTAAINAALAACPPGGVVYLPGSHALTGPITVPPQVTLMAAHGAHIDQLASPTLKPLASFSGAAVILLVDQTTGGYSRPSNEQRLHNLTIDCSAVGGSTLDAIQVQGFVHGVYITDVGVYHAPNHGFTSVSNASGGAYSFRVTRLHVQTTGGIGINASMTDSLWSDCEVITAGSHGWFVAGAANSQFIGCKSEWSNNDGFNMGGTGTGQGSGGPIFVGCTTDRNKNNGFSFPSAATGNAPVSLIGCTLRRDGSASTSAGYAAVNVNGGTCPVLISGLAVYPGVNDDGSGNLSPQYGISVTSAGSVDYANSFLHAASAGFNDGGGNTSVTRGLNIQERTGATASPTVVTRGLRAYGSLGDSLDVPAHAVGIAHPREHGAIAWTVDGAAVNGGSAPTSGAICLSALYVSRPVTATKIYWGTTTAGASPVAGQNFVGLYNSAGTQLASVGVDARVTVANGFFNEAISVALTPGTYYVAWLFNATTTPTVLRSPNINGSLVNFNLTASTARFATNGTGTTLPSTLTMSSNVNSTNPLWTALA